MALAQLSITDLGREMLASAQNGDTITFIRAELGDGSLGSEPPAKRTKLINKKMNIPIADVTVNSGVVDIVVNVLNTNVETGFFARELGLFAKDKSGKEILYCYSNAENNADYINKKTETVIEKQLNITIEISDNLNVTAVIDQSVIFATKSELVNHKSAAVIDHPDKSVTTEKIADGAITEDKLADNSINRNKLIPGCVETIILKDGAVVTEKIADNTITAVKLQKDSVTRDKIHYKAIDTNRVEDKAITTVKIAEGAVTAAKAGDGVVTSVDTKIKHIRESDGVLQYSLDGTVWKETQGKLDFIYECTGVNDDLKIETIINDFLKVKPNTSLGLTILGTSKFRTSGLTPTGLLQDAHINIQNPHSREASIYINAENWKMDIPFSFPGPSHMFALIGEKCNVFINGLKADTASGTYFIYNKGNLTLKNCDIGRNANNLVRNEKFLLIDSCICEGCFDVGGSSAHTIINNSRLFVLNDTGGAVISPGYGSQIFLDNCTILQPKGYGIRTFMSSDTATFTSVKNCRIAGGTQDIEQSNPANTVSWYLSGNSFSKPNIIIDGTTPITEKISSKIYMPAYANRFSQTIT